MKVELSKENMFGGKKNSSEKVLWKELVLKMAY
jgi:hypothetical protein